MNSGFPALFLTALIALAVENAVFFRVLGFNRHMMLLKSLKEGILYGGVFTVAAVLSSLPVCVVNALLTDNGYITFIRAPLYFLCVTSVYVPAYLLTRRHFPVLFANIRNLLPISFFNTALFGMLYVSATNSFDAFETVGYALGGGIGYTAAVLLVYYARKRLAFCPAPRSFRGLPLLLVYIGILSMALYGIIGQGLPS